MKKERKVILNYQEIKKIDKKIEQKFKDQNFQKKLYKAYKKGKIKFIVNVKGLVMAK